MAVPEKLVVVAGVAHGVVLDGNGHAPLHAPWQDVASRGVFLDLDGEGGGPFVPGVACRSIAAGKVETCFADGAVFRNHGDTDGGLAMPVGRVAVSAFPCKALLASCLLHVFWLGGAAAACLGGAGLVQLLRRRWNALWVTLLFSAMTWPPFLWLVWKLSGAYP